MHIVPLLALAITTSTPKQYFTDSFLICGPEPLEQCLQLAQECLEESYQMGFDNDLAFDYCADEIESLNPYLIHWIGEAR